MTTDVYVCEHKTTTSDIGLGSDYWKRLTLDAQISTYLQGARSLGFDPDGILYDVARRPTLRPYKATPVEERKYVEPKSRACKECKKKSPAPGPHIEDGITCVDGRIVTDPGGRLYANQRETDETPEEFAERIRADIASDPDKYYQRGFVMRIGDEERDAAYDSWVHARQIREAQLAHRWPRNVDACERYGVTCDFWPVCLGESSIDDDTRYRTAESAHEELDGTAGTDNGKVHLPVLSASALRTFRSCPRAYQFRYEMRRRPIQKSDALRFGTLFHHGLEAWWKTADIGAAFAAMAGEADPFERVRAEELMRGYHARWINERIDVLAVEAEFEMPLVNPETGAESRTWRFAGKIDAIARVHRAAVAA